MNKQNLRNLIILFCAVFAYTSCLSDPFADDSEDTNKKPAEHDKTTYVPQLDSTKVIYIDWGDTLAITKYMPDDSVSLTINGHDVIVNSIVNDTIEYVLSGKTVDGMFKVYSEHNFNLVFNDVEIRNQRGPAINIQSKKRAYMYIFGESENKLEDGYSYQAPSDAAEDQKGTMFAEGKIIIDGDSLATLDIVSNSAHAICSDAYVSIINGNITLNAATDGIHANDEVSIEAGNLNIIAKSDGIECEAGRIEINGGIININCDDKGLSTSYRGTSSKIVPDIIINGGEIDILVNLINGKGIRSIGDFAMTEGKIKVFADKLENEGIESKKAMNIYGGDILLEVFDNGLNSGTDMNIYGGTIFSHSFDNDGIDSNGRIIISGGKIVAIGAGELESGFDCGTNAFRVNGGIFVGLGSATTKPSQSGSSQPSVLFNQRLEKGNTISLQSEAGKNLMTFTIPSDIDFSTCTLVSTPELSLNSSMNIYINGSVSGGDDFYGINTGGSFSGGTLLTKVNIENMLTELQ